MTTRGLPGFIRRTLRVDNSEDEDDAVSPQQTPATGIGLGETTSDTHGIRIVRLDDSSNVDDRRNRTRSLDSSDSAFRSADSGNDSFGFNAEGEHYTRTSTGTADTADTATAAAETNENGESDGHNVTRRTSSQGSATVDSQPGSDLGSVSSLDNSPQSSSRNIPNQHILVERKPSYRETQYEKVISADVVQLSELRKLAWNGIPREHRGTAWKLMLGYVPVNRSRRDHVIRRKRAEYRDTIAQHYDIDADTRSLQEQETLRQVLVDVPRTAPEVPLFRNEKIRRSLGRMLYIWAMRHPASSYVQGINDLATPLYAVFLADLYDGEDVLDGNIMVLLDDEKLDDVEADCYWCLTNILAGIQDHYTADQPGVQRMVMRLEELVNRIDADLCTHLRETGIQFLQFAFKWMNCLLLREFPLRCVIRLWDTYISENGFEDFHVYVCAAFLCQFSSQLQCMEFDELFGFMQNIPTEEWTDMEIEMLLSQAYVLSTLFGGSDAHLTSVAASNPMIM